MTDAIHAWHPEQPRNRLPALPPAYELEAGRWSRASSRRATRWPSAPPNTCARASASLDLHDLARLGVLREMPFGKEKRFIHPGLMKLLSHDNNPFQPYA